MTPDESDALREAAARLREVDGAARGLSAAMGGALRGALERATGGSQRFADVVRGLAADLARTGLRAAVAPVTQALGEGLTGVATQAAGAVAGGLGALVRGFARGGVVSGATGFVSAQGPGVMGEAGPEAILPLARGADGRLGVRGGGGVQVTLNLTTPDAESFQRSRSQVAAALARAVERGAARL
jgi:lambda family phage tail tape measure protein